MPSGRKREHGQVRGQVRDAWPVAGAGVRRPAGASGARGHVAAGAGACVAREELGRERKEE